MIKVLICGANGQLGNECRVLAPEFPEMDFRFTDIDELNICDEQAVVDFLRQEQPDVLLNCAAYTAVDKAETDQENAYRVNRDAAGYLSRACNEMGSFFIHVSTDYVFDGEGKAPYREEDPPCPVSAYGKSKYEGELEVMKSAGNAVIIRTSWLYSSFGGNFVKTMLRLAKEKGEVRVVNDQQGSPTNASDLARAILTVVPEFRKKTGVHLYHFANTGVTTWYHFARAIFEMAGIPCVVHPVTTAEYPTPTRRPKYSVMDTRKFSGEFNYFIPDWKNALERCLKVLNH